MDIKLINVGYGNFISSSRIIAIIGPESAPVKRIIQEAREERRLIDATYGPEKTNKTPLFPSCITVLPPQR